MTTPTYPSVTDELLAEIESLAVGAKGWNMPHAFQDPEEGFLPEDWEWYVGQVDEEGNRYPVLNVNAHQYDSDDSEKLARYYAACNRDTILSITQELSRLRAENEELKAALQDIAEYEENDTVELRRMARYAMEQTK